MEDFIELLKKLLNHQSPEIRTRAKDLIDILEKLKEGEVLTFNR